MAIDENALFERLDLLFERNNFAEIERLIREISQDELTTELRFRLVSALNNQKKFPEAIKELRALEPLCTTTAENARFWYSAGFAHYMNDCELTALHCFEQAAVVDPEDTAGLDIKGIIEECRGYINQDLADLNAFGKTASEAVRECFAKVDEKDRKALSDTEFTLYLGYLSGIRVPPPVQDALNFDDPLKKYSEEEKSGVKMFLRNYYGISDLASFKNFYVNDLKYNGYRVASDALAYSDKNPNFPFSQLTQEIEEMFGNCALFLNAVRDYLPKTTVLAWDISEKIGAARLAFSCDVIPDGDYFGCMGALLNAAKESFSSFEEYVKSLIFGGGFFMFLAENFNIKSSIAFMENLLTMLVNSPLSEIKWG